MNESPVARVALFVIILVGVGGLLGYAVHNRFGGLDPATASADSQSLAQIEQQLNGIEKRLGALESRRKADSVKATPDAKEPAAPEATPSATPRPARAQVQVSPAFTHRPDTLTVLAPSVDSASAKRISTLEQGMGALKDETSSNREAWQAAADRLAEVAGQVGAQDGQIIKNQDELSRFLGRSEHTAVSFELRRSSGPEAVGPVRISLKTSNQKSQRYTVCVYLQDSCVQMRDRVVYEVVQLAVSHDTAPLELIATKVDKDGIVGYLEVPRGNAGH